MSLVVCWASIRAQLAAYEEGTEEYDNKKEELMDEWRDAYFDRQKKKREREKRRNPQASGYT